MIRFTDRDVEVTGKWAEEVGTFLILLLILIPSAAMCGLLWLFGVMS